jgi:hypothetical protein
MIAGTDGIEGFETLVSGLADFIHLRKGSRARRGRGPGRGRVLLKTKENHLSDLSLRCFSRYRCVPLGTRMTGSSG